MEGRPGPVGAHWEEGYTHRASTHAGSGARLPVLTVWAYVTEPPCTSVSKMRAEESLMRYERTR